MPDRPVTLGPVYLVRDFEDIGGGYVRDLGLRPMTAADTLAFLGADPHTGAPRWVPTPDDLRGARNVIRDLPNGDAPFDDDMAALFRVYDFLGALLAALESDAGRTALDKEET